MSVYFVFSRKEYALHCLRSAVELKLFLSYSVIVKSLP